LSGVLTASSVFPSGVSATGLTGPVSKVMKSTAATAIVGTTVNIALNSNTKHVADRRIRVIMFLTLAFVAGMVFPLFSLFSLFSLFPAASKRGPFNAWSTLYTYSQPTIGQLLLAIKVST
jgi:ABC-type tungstate transport system substrate-binding protein